MSSIQDRIRRLQASGDGDESVPVSGTVAAAKARLARSSIDTDAGKPRTVSNIASKFKADGLDDKEDKNGARPPSVSELRERVAASSTKDSANQSVTARAAALTGANGGGGGGSGSAQVTARLGALNSRAADNGGVAARAGKFEKAFSEDVSKVSGLVSMRSNQLEEEKKMPSAPSTPLKSRTAIFEGKKEVTEEKESAPSRVAAVTAAFSKKGSDVEEQPKVGRVASAAKDRELHEVRTELSDMVAVSQELLSELAQLRKGMREMEVTRDALLKRIEKLEKKAK